VSLDAESSAVLSWLLDEDSSTHVRRLLGAAEVIVASDLTLIECDRVILRAVALGELTEADAADDFELLGRVFAEIHALTFWPQLAAPPTPPHTLAAAALW
jgi:predicted nucleic acid-binding protein